MTARGSFTPHLGSALQTGGALFLGGVVVLNMYTLTSNTTGTSLSLRVPADGIRFNAFVFAGGGNGGATVSGLITQFGQGGAGGGRAEISYDKVSGGALDLSFTAGTVVSSDSDRSAGFSQGRFGSISLLEATGGLKGRDGGRSTADPRTGGSGTVANATVTGWTIDAHTTPTYTGTEGVSLSGGGDNNFGGGVGGNTGGTQGTTSLTPLVDPQGRGGNGSGASSNRSGQFPGGGGGGSGISGVFVGPGSGANGGIVIEVIAGEGLSAGDFNLTGFGFVDNGPI